MRDQDDHKHSERILQQPAVDEYLSRRVAVDLVVDIEHRHHPQQDHRESHMHAEQTVDELDGLTG